MTKTKRYSFNELVQILNIPLNKHYFLVTYHPSTLSEENPKDTCELLFDVFAEFPDYDILFTYPNADNGGYDIVLAIESFCQKRQNAWVCKSLGNQAYLSAIAHAELVLGNSSSGIIEVPSLGVPSINIGSRQQGRLASDSVIHAKVEKEDIIRAINQSLSISFKQKAKHAINPYGSGDVSSKIMDVLLRVDLNIIKPFYDMEIQNECIT